VVGRKESVGKPLLFATTESFLKRFGLKSLEQLPNQEILLERLTVINQPAAPVQASLYNYEIGKEIAKNSGETRSAMDEVAITTDDVPDFLKDEKDLVRH
ncbi:MAG: SMC-Scp complex subunit ScpB, partial [Firmicutes bacterium]|nr:SMC-Scp complex subunit ScpB [Bacillota bacterium]